jgi:hypothetical protein
VLGADLAAAGVLGADLAAGVLGADLAADDKAADGDAELPAALVSAAFVDGLFDVDATTMTMSAPNEMSPVSTLCRAGQDLRLCPFGVCGGMAGCCGHGGGWAASC